MATTKGKRGRPTSEEQKAKQERSEEGCGKVKRKVDRFNGMSPEEVMTKTLPDILAYNLDMLIVSPGQQALPEVRVDVQRAERPSFQTRLCAFITPSSVLTLSSVKLSLVKS